MSSRMYGAMLFFAFATPTQWALAGGIDGSTYESLVAPTASPSGRRDAVNIREYLGSCTCTNVDDCASSAANRAKAVGAVLYFPAGTYPLSAWSPPCPLQIVGDGEGKTVLQRPAETSKGTVISSSNCGALDIRELTLDGNKANNSTVGYTIVLDGDWNVTLTNVEIRNSKGAGSALSLRSTRDDSENTRTRLSSLYLHDNDGNGIYIQFHAWNWVIRDSVIRNNGGIGVSVIDYVFPPTSEQFSGCSVVNNDVSYNAGSGISLTSDITGGVASRPSNGLSATVQNCEILGNKVNYNRNYGIIMAGGYRIRIGSNAVAHNGTGRSAEVAGINSALCRECDIHGNTSEYNDYYGIDSGGAVDSTVHDNVITNNGNATVNSGNGINCGACRSVDISNNLIGSNGWANGGAQIHITTYDSGIAGLPLSAQNISVRGNRLICANSNEVGVQVLSDPPDTTIEDNWAQGCTLLNGYVLHVTTPKVHGNRQDNWVNGISFTPTRADVVYPDAVENITLLPVPGNEIKALRPYFYSTNYQTVYAVVVTAGGSGYSSSPNITFTGGGCRREPAGRVFQDNSGHVVGVNLTAYGAGCSAAPSAVITDSSGSGARATAYVLNALPINGRELKVQSAPGLTLREDPKNLNLQGGTSFTVPGGSPILSSFEGRENHWIEIARRALAP